MNITISTEPYVSLITVTAKEDGIITDCNHAGASIEDVIVDRLDYDSGCWTPDDSESSMVCDKCPAWLVPLDGGGEWVL